MNARLLFAVPLAAALASSVGYHPAEGAAVAACPASPDDQVWVPGGETTIGSDSGYPEEGPIYRTHVEGFWIDRHEVTNRQFAEFVAATGHVTAAEREGGSIVFDPPAAGEVPVHPSQWWKYRKGADWRHPAGPDSNLVGKAELPVVHVAHSDALAYARWKGRALPSEEQFEYAARAGRARTFEQPAIDEANTWQGSFPTRNDRSDGYAAIAPVGCYKANPFGLDDMIGNVWEWTASWYLPSHGPLAGSSGAPGNPSFDPAQPGVRTRVIKGGSFLCAPNYCARYRPEARHAQAEDAGTSHLGFRTVRRRP